MSNPGCGCKGCTADTAAFWPAAVGAKDCNEPGFTSDDFYWSFEWHCARNHGWSEWYDAGDELI